MKKPVTIKLFRELAAAIFILLFMYTGISKLTEHRSFELVLSQSPLLKGSSYIISWLVPVIEIITSALLFFPVSRKIGLIVSMILMVFFTCYIGYMLLFTPSLPCSCGGIIKELNWSQHLLFNGLCILLAILALWLPGLNDLFIAINRKSRTPV